MTQQAPINILLVEDDTMLRDSLQHVLEDAGYQVTGVSDGETACMLLHEAPRHGYDLVLTDLLLRVTNGIEVLRTARGLEDPPEVVLLTGYGSLSTAIEALRAGVYDYLLKPCKPDELLRVVEGALDRRQEQHESLVRDGVPVAALPSAGESAAKPLRYWRIGALAIDRYNGHVTFGDRRLQLTPTEYALLCCLAEAQGAIVPFHQIAHHTYDHSGILSDAEAHQLLKTHIHNLRRKLDAAYIVNVRGVGYRLVDPQFFGEPRDTLSPGRTRE